MWGSVLSGRVCALPDHNHVYIAARMPLFSTNRGYIGASNTVFTVLSAHSVLQDEEKVRVLTRLLGELPSEMG